MQIEHNIPDFNDNDSLYFSEALKRMLSDMKAKDLSEQTGISPGHISDMKKHKKRPSFETAAKIASACGFSSATEFIMWGKALHENLPEVSNKTITSTIGFGDKIEADHIKAKTAQLDPVLLKEVIDGVEKHLAKIDQSLSIDLKSKLIALLYDRYAETGENVDKKKIAHYLKLVA